MVPQPHISLLHLARWRLMSGRLSGDSGQRKSLQPILAKSLRERFVPLAAECDTEASEQSGPPMGAGMSWFHLAVVRSMSPWPGKQCGAAVAVGTSSSQSLRVQVGTRYRDQDPGRASSRGRCLLALGMYDLTHPAAPPSLSRDDRGARQPLRAPRPAGRSTAGSRSSRRSPPPAWPDPSGGG